MKIKLELYGASRELSKKNFIEFNLNKKSSIKDLKKKILNYVDNNFKGNDNFKKIIESSAFVLKIIILFLIIMKLVKIKKLELFPLSEVVNASRKSN
tara:strand:+ start:453 stop:743 length:291 start_codon:yes stop_codon:yes gene_type:complete